MIRSHNRFVLAAALGAAILFPIGCASSHRDVNTGTNNTNSPNFAPGTTSDTTSMSRSMSSPAVNGTSSQTETTNTTYSTPATNLNTQSTTTSSNAQSTTVTNPDGSTTTTTTNPDGSTTTVTRSASGALINSSNATSSQTTTTNVTTGNANTGTTKITTTTTTTFYGQPAATAPATATATVTTPPTYVQPSMASSTAQTDLGPPVYGFGRSHNHGRSVDLNLFAAWADFTNASRTGGGLPGTVATGPLGTSFKNANGYGASLNMFFAPALSVEFGASRITPGATFIPSVAGVPTFTGTKVRMTPITGTLQWHFLANHSFDPYIGLGGAYVMFNSTSNIVNSGGSGFQSVGFSDRGGPLANAGVSIGFGRSVGLIFDAKYIRLRGNGTTNFGTGAGITPTAATFDLNPLILSGGIRFGF